MEGSPPERANMRQPLIPLVIESELFPIGVHSRPFAVQEFVKQQPIPSRAGWISGGGSAIRWK